MARPKGSGMVTCDELVENWRELALDGYAQGMSDVEIRGRLARPPHRVLGMTTWENLMKDPRFSETIKEGRQLSEMWWEQHSRKNLSNSKFNTSLWFINMKNRFKWKDKQPEEVAHIIQPSTPVDPKQILDILENFGKK